MPNKRQTRGGTGRGGGATISHHFKPKETNKGSEPASHVRATKAELRKAKIHGLLQATEDYEPMPAELSLAEKLCDLEHDMKHAKPLEQGKLEIDYKKALTKLNNLITNRMVTTGVGSGNKPVEVEEEKNEMEVDNEINREDQEEVIQPEVNDDDEQIEAPPKRAKSAETMDIDKEDEAIIEQVEKRGDFVTHRRVEKISGGNSTENETSAPPKENKSTEMMDIDKEDEAIVEKVEKRGASVPHQEKEQTKGANSIENEASTQSKEKQPVQNPYGKKPNTPNKWQGETSLNSALKGEKVLKEKRSHIFRVRIRFEAKQKDGHELTRNLEALRAVKAIKKHISKTDQNSEMLRWVEDKEAERETAINNVEALSPQEASCYIGLPKGRRHLGTGKIELGVRIASNLTLDQFLDKSGKHRKEKRTWMFTRQAEMQGAHEAHAIGFCVGSSPKKITQLLNERLTDEMGMKGKVLIEVSWQVISKEGIGKQFSDTMWNHAKEMRDKHTPSGVSKGYTYNLHTPSALIVYISDPKYKRHVRLEMQKKFGGGKKVANWNEWPDGSRMRFIPYFLPTSSLRNREKAAFAAEFQIHTRVNETVRDIEVRDIFSPQPYLEGKTMHEAILNITSGKGDGSYVFKQILKKWTPNHLDTHYEVSSFSSKTEEANLTAESIMAIMVETYGNEVARHFPGGSYHYTDAYKKDVEEEDPELEKIFGETGFDTESVLEPGWKSAIELRKQKTANTEVVETYTLEGASTIKLSTLGEGSTAQDGTSTPPHQATTVEGTAQNDTPKTQSDAVSLLTVDNSITTDISDDNTVVTANTDKSTSPDRKKWTSAKLVQQRLLDLRISEQQLEEWKDQNPSTMETLQVLYRKRSRNALNVAALQLMEEMMNIAANNFQRNDATTLEGSSIEKEPPGPVNAPRRP